MFFIEWWQYLFVVFLSHLHTTNISINLRNWQINIFCAFSCIEIVILKENEWKIRRQHHVIFSVATDSFDNTRKIFWNHHVLLIAKVWTIYNIEQYSGHTVLTNVILHKRDNGASSKKRYYVKWQQCLDGSDTATTSINWAKLMFLLQIFESLQHLVRVNKNLFLV